ncbi:MAG: hypothetical protein CMO19_03245 [Thaumarchaeota archaeon]|nr:hypothetical protein [Nitrososphaerota archaeon]|tara:strand:- start:361 stop:1563 length:1203 start_codon:yes stop_codon:yes gene_type:complete
MNKIDVVVIGIGPAGAMTLLRLAELGIGAIGIDSKSEIAEKLCTGIIGWECSQKYPPDSEDVHYVSNSATVVSPVGFKLKIKSSIPQAVVLDRVSYIKSIAAKAQLLGSKILLDNNVVSVSVKDTGVEIITDKGESFISKIVVIATGFHSPLLKDLSIIKKDVRQEYMVASQAIVRVNDIEGIQVYLGKQNVPGSFAWLVPTHEQNALIGMFTRSRLQGHMNKLITELSKDGIVDTVIKSHSQWGIPAAPIGRTFSDRLLVVGDAAGLVKPTTGGGIYYSFISGEIAAEVICDAIESDSFSYKTLRSYQTKWKTVLNNEIQIGLNARKLLESFSDDQIEVLISHLSKSDFLNDLTNSSVMSFDWHGRVISHFLRNPSLWKLMNSFGPIAQTVLSLVRQKI